RAEPFADERVGVTRAAPRRAHLLAHRTRALLQQRAEHRLLVGEVVVERAGGQVGATDDVAHRRGAVAQVGEDLARGLEDGLAVGLLGGLPAALGREVGHRSFALTRKLNMTHPSGYRA